MKPVPLIRKIEKQFDGFEKDWAKLNNSAMEIKLALRKNSFKKGCPNCDEWKSYRTEGEGSGRVDSLFFNPKTEQVEIKLYPQKDYPTEEQLLLIRFDGVRWYHGGVIGRSNLEKLIGAGFGYCDAIEDMYGVVFGYVRDRYVTEKIKNLEEENKKLKLGLDEKESKKLQEKDITIRKLKKTISSLSNDVDRLKKVKSYEQILEEKDIKEIPDVLSEKLNGGVKGLREITPETIGEQNYSKVYFLFERNELQYIGMSSQPGIGRIITHKREGKIPFTNAYYLPCLESDVENKERELIKLFKPPYNKKIWGGN